MQLKRSLENDEDYTCIYMYKKINLKTDEHLNSDKP